jgi:streptomycin 6-kinase
MAGIRRPVPERHRFPLAIDWLRDARAPGTLPGTKRTYPWVVPMLDQAAALAAEPAETFVLHGDLHHDNILSATREPWLAIDPHGVVGDPAWEIAPYLFNHLPNDHDLWRKVIRRRTDQLAEALSLDRRRVYLWSAVRALQSSFWSFHDGPSDDFLWDEGVICAEELAKGP